MSALGDALIEAEEMAAEVGLIRGEVSVRLRDGVTVARISWPDLALVGVERYPTEAEARQVVGRRNVELCDPYRH